MEIRPLHGISGTNRRADLSGGNHVHTHAFLPHDLIQALEGRRFGGVQHTGIVSERLPHSAKVGATTLADTVLIHQIQRGSVLPGKHFGILPGKEQVSVFSHRQISAYQVGGIFLRRHL